MPSMPGPISRRTRRMLAASAVASTVLAGCGAEGGSVDIPAGAGEVTGTGDVIAAAVERSPTQAPDDDVRAVVARATDFAAAFHQQVTDGQNGNVFSSPWSITSAFAMLHPGAVGDTADEIRDGLRLALADDGDRLHAALNTLDQALESRGQDAEGVDGSPFVLRNSNAVWGLRGYPYVTDYLDVLATHHGAGLRLVDFVGSPEGARGEINDWVADQTEQRITDLMPEGSVTADTRLVLTNAVYFNAAWASPFTPEVTTDGPFSRPDGSAVDVPLMAQTASFQHTTDGDLDVVSLPYDGNEVDMVLVVPRTGSLVDELDGLDGDRIRRWFDGLSGARVALTMPRFEITTEIDLTGHLQAMGVQDVFAPNSADLTGITRSEPLYVSAAVHQATITVDEQGTEAAAATGLSIGTTSAPIDPPVEVRADRPFLFLIRDVATDTVLFVGQVTDPS